jgi:1-aminocyclopropane-1-carboxylate deaminase/D-cysteine desulfhydrase-like pyridoxal-dependent ACC family enzyme
MTSEKVPLQLIGCFNEVTLYMLRLDLNHPHISGNKLYKLHYNLSELRSQNKNKLLTFGGAFSNHIAATAAAGKEQNIKTIGIIRGDELPEPNPTLRFAKDCGMELHFVSRESYRDKNKLENYVKEKFPADDLYIIPEGGANAAGIKGCREIVPLIEIDFDVICCPCGTGTTLAGIILSLKEQQLALGFQVLKAEHYISNEIKKWLQLHHSQQSNWSISEEYHFGGYAKTTPALDKFILDFEKEHSIPLDHLYTGKMMYGISDMLGKGMFRPGQTVVAIHTGGLQGETGFRN